MPIDRERTRKYYADLSAEAQCDCAYCENYRLQVKEAYPELAEFLDGMGIDIAKPFETMPLEPGEQGMLEYSICQYVVMGKLPGDFSKKIGEVTIDISEAHPSTDSDQAHDVIDIYPIKLKWIL